MSSLLNTVCLSTFRFSIKTKEACPIVLFWNGVVCIFFIHNLGPLLNSMLATPWQNSESKYLWAGAKRIESRGKFYQVTVYLVAIQEIAF
jgi:hypothetical protein